MFLSLLHQAWSTGWNEKQLNGSTMQDWSNDQSHHEQTFYHRIYTLLLTPTECQIIFIYLTMHSTHLIHSYIRTWDVFIRNKYYVGYWWGLNSDQPHFRLVHTVSGKGKLMWLECIHLHRCGSYEMICKFRKE